jgi:hypothetical protein
LIGARAAADTSAEIDDVAIRLQPHDRVVRIDLQALGRAGNAVNVKE